MRKFYFLLTAVFLLISVASISQSVAINSTGAQPDSSTMLDVQSTAKGVLFPKMTDNQRLAIHSPATGLLVYQSNGVPGFYFNIGTPSAPSWILLAKDNLLPNVIPGNDTTVNLDLATDSIRLSGSATDKDGTISGYFWSQVSGPNTALFGTAGAASTVVRGLVNGTYTFQLMATDNRGATAMKSMSVTVIMPQLTNLVLQPHQNPNEVGLAVYYGGDASDESASEFGATAWTSAGSPAITRGIFKFDLGSIPVNANIISAKLSLYSNPTPQNGDLVHANAGNNNSMLIEKVISNWTNTITWYNQPFTDDSSQALIPHTNQSLLDLTDIDVTDMVKSMAKNANYGFFIKLENESAYNSRIFCSSKYADATKHPKLEIQYIK